MSDRDTQDRDPEADRRFAKAVRRKAARRRQRADERSVWFWFGMFGMVGWSVAVPTVVFTAVGIWLDRSWPGRVSWTLTLLFAGIATGCVTAWYWVRHESEDR